MKFGATIYVDGCEQSEKAVEMYKEAFGLTLGYHEAYNDNSWKAEHGVKEAENPETLVGYFHADLVRDGETVFSVSAEGDGGISRGVQFIELSMHMGSEEAVKKAVSVLSEGTITPHDHGFNPCAAGVTDPFNVNWFICV